MPPYFKIDFLDHVAIRAKDIEQSAQWYESILGLKRVQPKEWKPWPIFMLAGNSGVAIFPEKEGHVKKVDHFAFRVSQPSYEAAKEHLKAKGIDFQEQDHIYFDSIYFKDPDAHMVELTVEKKF